MAEKKLGSFAQETPKKKSPPRKAGSATRAALTSTGGRPSKSDDPKFVVKQVLRIYVHFLRTHAPEGWKDRQLNFELFDRTSAEQRLTSDISVTNGLVALLDRKSIPRLTAGQLLSEGILRAEKLPRFTGGLQILYHPYVTVLSAPTDLVIIRKLIAMCRHSQSMGLFQYSAFGAIRVYRNVEEEIQVVSKCVESLRLTPALWKRAFPDLIAIALSLALEAVAIDDRHRLNSWKKWFKSKRLRFQDWSVGDQTACEALDRWVEFQFERLTVCPIDVFPTCFEYLVKHVIVDKPIHEEENSVTNDEMHTTSMTPPELAWLFLSSLDGKCPTEQDVDKILKPYFMTEPR